MKSPFQRRTAFVAVLLAPALAACGFGAQTDQIYQAAQGVDDRTTSVWILNAVVVAAENGSGTFAGSFSNQSDKTQVLQQVSADGVTPTKSAESISLLPGTLLNLGQPVEGPKGQELPLLALTGGPIEIGLSVRLTFTFSDAGTVTIDVPVVSNSPEVGHDFDNVPLPPNSEPTTDESSEPSDEPTDVSTEDTEGHAE